MKKYLYLIKKAKIKSWLKFWLLTKDQVKYILSEILEGFSFNLQNTVKRYFKIFNIFGNSIQDGTPTPTNPVPIKSVADDVNLWNNELDNNAFNDNGIKEYSTIFVMNKVAIDVIPNTSYVVSQKEHPCQQRIIFLNNDTYLSRVNNTIDTTNGHTEFTFVTPENCNKIHIMFRSTVEVISTTGSYVIHPDDITNVKLQKGTVATPYSPYNYGTFTIDFEGQTENYNYTFITEPLRSLPNGVRDSLEDDGIHRKVGIVIVDNGYIINTSSWNGYVISIPDKKYIGNNSLLCTKAIFVNTSNIQVGTIYENPTGAVFVGNSEDTLETLKAKYNGAVVLYELAEEVIEPYTEEQQEQYNKIKELYTFDGTTNISSTDVVPPYLQIQYYMKGE